MEQRLAEVETPYVTDNKKSDDFRGRSRVRPVVKYVTKICIGTEEIRFRSSPTLTYTAIQMCRLFFDETIPTIISC